MKKIQHKFVERWQLCFLHFCMPMVMNPECRLEHIKSQIRYKSNKEDDFHEVHDTLLSLFNEYSNPLEDPNNCNSRSKVCKGTVADMDRLVEYYSHYANQYSERPMTELDQYVQDPHLSTGKPSVLQWWKEHRLAYPTIARMARDIFALPSSTDCKLATRIARLAVSVSDSTRRIEELVCLQDWLTPAGMICAQF
ncbi:hypothetical protein QOZ80_6BG0487170 [Eleusine coracana subsp. coracana]|nr:hypothetical protein QOZ80_6BG0487170 [Eleusine coracana subsp. coracana]